MHLLLACIFSLASMLAQTQARAPARAKVLKPPPVLDINQATAEDFQKLPGIGPKLAERIMVFRRKHGPFRRVEDLMAIKGMGMKKWKALRPYLRVEGNSRESPK